MVLLVHRVLKPGTPRKGWLLVASYFFYGYWDWRFLLLIGASTLIDFVCGQRISDAPNRVVKKRWLYLSLAANLGLLGFFKYFNFFLTSGAAALTALGFQVNYTALTIILPVGISFYTFQTLSYSIDIYRGQLKPSPSLLDFSLFVAFFPQLVAGPIVRASEFLPQLVQEKPRRADDFFEGLERFLLGLFKKILIADMAAKIVDPVFQDPDLFSGFALAAGALCFTLQIYFDFSGYSDMAIGLARMLGYELPQNFRLPFLATSMTDFWRRWHISLSSWFRDYVYIPLGGNRCTSSKTYRNLVLTFLLTGLWHGANWTFLVFGAIHGSLLLIERLGRQIGGEKTESTVLGRTLGFFYCFAATIVAFTVFRSSSMSVFFELAERVVTGAKSDDVWFSSTRFAYVLLLALAYHALAFFDVRQKLARRLDPWIWRPFFYSTIVFLILAYAPLNERSFIYFAF